MEIPCPMYGSQLGIKGGSSELHFRGFKKRYKMAQRHSTTTPLMTLVIISNLVDKLSILSDEVS
jgi:hypothetical protein